MLGKFLVIFLNKDHFFRINFLIFPTHPPLSLSIHSYFIDYTFSQYLPFTPATHYTPSYYGSTRVPEFTKTNKKSRVNNIVSYFFGAMAATFKVGKMDYKYPPIPVSRVLHQDRHEGS